MRRFLHFISVLAIVLFGLVSLAHTGPTSAQDGTPPPEGQGFVGSWLMTISAADGAPFLGLATFSADGTVVASPHPVALPPPGGPGVVTFWSAGHGASETTGPDATIFTFVALIADGQGSPVGTVTIRGSLELGADGQTFSGDATATFTDPGGNTVAILPETIQATRIVAEAPELPSATPTT